MNRWYVRIAPLALAILQFGCSQAPSPAPDMRASDEKAIRESETQWVKDFATKDMDKVVSHYADDGAVLMPNLAIMTGKDAIRAGLKSSLADPAFSVDLNTVKVEVSKAGDLAYSQGTYMFTGTDPKSKRKVTEKGKYVEVYKKQADGTWKVVEDVNNADAPAVAVKPKAAAARSKRK